MSLPITAIDLCCGAGGWAAAARGLPIRFVAVADHAPDCLETWALNHSSDHPDCELAEIDLATPLGMAGARDAIAGHHVELVLGGIPCEEISVARAPTPASDEAMAGFYDLLDSLLDFVDELAPRWWCLEDVTTIEPHLTPLLRGRPIPFRRIDSAPYSPQRRVRTFVGSFPRPAAPPNGNGARTLSEALRPGPYRTLRDLGRYREHYTQWQSRDTYRAWRPDRPAFTVLDFGTARHSRAAMTPGPADAPRFLEWQELARLQGFPDDYVFVGSLTRTCKMVAQAIQVDLGHAILSAIVAAHD